MNPIDNLIALSTADIESIAAKLLRSGNVATWEKEMRASLTRAHTAAYVIGTADRLGVEAGTALINARNLSKAERGEIAALVNEQLGYLQGFAKAIADGTLTPRGLAARAAMYSGAVRETYNLTRWGAWDLPFVPGDGSTECMTNCKCSIDIVDSGDGQGLLYWRLGATERHCKTCPGRARQSPYAIERKKVA